MICLALQLAFDSLYVAAAPSNPTGTESIMNNGRRDTTSSDIQKLQQQLQDIKEQVRLFLIFLTFFVKYLGFFLLNLWHVVQFSQFSSILNFVSVVRSEKISYFDFFFIFV